MALKIYDLHLGLGIAVCTRDLGERLTVFMHINERSIENDTLINRGFHKLDKVCNNANIGIRGFTT